MSYHLFVEFLSHLCTRGTPSLACATDPRLLASVSALRLDVLLGDRVTDLVKLSRTALLEDLLREEIRVNSHS